MKLGSEALRPTDQIAADYLQCLDALAEEISVSMDAIAANALSRFQESVAKQEVICASVAMLADTIGVSFSSANDPSDMLADISVEANIRAKIAAIRELNLQYAAVLRHSSKSIALLALLCRSHIGQCQETHGIRRKYQTWSCEM